MIIYSVSTRDDLRSLPVAPPAMAYCRDDGNYYIKYAYVHEFTNTPFYSGIGDGWHNLDVSSPEFDRPIYVINTQWLNGWNLDYYPDYINTLAKARGMEELEGIFGHHYGPLSEYNTEITGLNPGDFIFRHQTFSGTIGKDHDGNDRIIHVDGLETEIPDKVFSSRNIPLQGDAFEAFGSCAKITINEQEYMILEHYPNSRTQDEHPDSGYPCEFDEENQIVDCRNIEDETHPAYDDSRFNSIWKPLGEPTTKIYINKELGQIVSEGDEFIIEVREWYIVSCEILDLCDGHKRQTWDYLSIAGADAPARFIRKIHSIRSENDIVRLYLSKKCIPGDFAYHEINKSWYQILSPFFGKLTDSYIQGYNGTITISGVPNIFQGTCFLIIEDQEYTLEYQNEETFKLQEELKQDHTNQAEVMIIYLPFADFTRILPINNLNHFYELNNHFDFHDIFLCNLTNTSQAYQQKLPYFSSEFDIEWENWERNLYPAELLYEE